MPAVNLDRVVQAFTAIRDARSAKKRAWEAEDVALETDQLTLKRLMLSLLNESGAKSISTDHGTVYRTTRIKPSGADWDAIWAWAKEHDASDIFEKRLKTAFIATYMEENNGAIPPGINVHQEYEVNVRRANNTTSKEPTDHE